MIAAVRNRALRFRLTPDGSEYIRMAGGVRTGSPYHLRFALPLVCRDNRYAWLAATWGGIAACSALTGVLAMQHGLTATQALVAALLWLGLPSVRFLASVPVLVDAAGMALALGAAVLWPIEPLAAVGVALLGAAVWEKAPVFAALFAWSPWLLVGLFVPALRALLVESGTMRNPACANRLQLDRLDVWRDASALVLPWGACLFALAEPSLWWGAVVLVAMAQLIVANDTVRLVQQAAPAVCVAAAAAIPAEWLLPVLVAHWFNPWMGEGL